MAKKTINLPKKAKTISNIKSKMTNKTGPKIKIEDFEDIWRDQLQENIFKNWPSSVWKHQL